MKEAIPAATRLAADPVAAVASARKPTRWLLAKWLVPILGLPILASIGVVAWFARQEALAAATFAELIQPIRAAGEPLGDAWMNQRFRQTTFTEGSVAWSKILMLSASNGVPAFAELPIIGNGATQPILDPSSPWEANERVGEFLQEMRPVIDLIHASTNCRKPVWQPMAFHGYDTLLPALQDARGVARLLQLDAEHALYNGDAQRAMAALRSMKATAEVFDWGVFQVGELLHLALLEMYYQQLQRSLQTRLWTLEQVDEWIEQIHTPMPLEKKWRDIWMCEEAMAMASMEHANVYGMGPEFQLISNPSQKLKVVRFYRELQGFASNSASEMSQRAEHYQQQEPSPNAPLLGYFWSNATGMANALSNNENSRRLTLTSLAVKKFQLVHQRWPEALAELTELGLSDEDWTIPEIGQLGYSAEADSAYVWGVDLTKVPTDGSKPKVAKQRPELPSESMEHSYPYMSIIKD